MMSRHFRLSSELTGAIAKRLPHAQNQLCVPGSFFNQFVTEIYIYKQTNNNRVLIVRIEKLKIPENISERDPVFRQFKRLRLYNYMVYSNT